MILANKITAEYFEPAYGADQIDQKITIPNTFNGMISELTPEAAEVYIKLGGNLLVKKETAPVKNKTEKV